MRTISLSSRERTRDWQLVVAIGFLVLTVLGAAVDRRNAFIDRSVASSRSAERAGAPLTTPVLVQEMMQHD